MQASASADRSRSVSSRSAHPAMSRQAMRTMCCLRTRRRVSINSGSELPPDCCSRSATTADSAMHSCRRPVLISCSSSAGWRVQEAATYSLQAHTFGSDSATAACRRIEAHGSKSCSRHSWRRRVAASSNCSLVVMSWSAAQARECSPSSDRLSHFNGLPAVSPSDRQGTALRWNLFAPAHRYQCRSRRNAFHLQRRQKMLTDRNASVLSRSGPAAAVVGVHVLIAYVLSISMGVVEAPRLVAPIEAIFIPEDKPAVPEPEIPVVKPEIADVVQPVDEPMPQIEFDEPVVPPADVQPSQNA